MYDDLARTQRSSLLEQLTLNMVIPSVLLSLAIAPPPVFSAVATPRVYGHTWPLMLGATQSFGTEALVADTPPRLMWMPLHYPADMLGAQREGYVVVKVRVDPDGHARWAPNAVTQGIQAEFVRSVRDAVTKAEFMPAMSAGVPTESWVIVSVYFDIYVE